jgi:hypothetical protein
MTFDIKTLVKKSHKNFSLDQTTKVCSEAEAIVELHALAD